MNASMTGGRRTGQRPISEGDLVECIKDAESVGLRHREFGAHRMALACLAGSLRTVAPQAALALEHMADAFSEADSSAQS